MSALTQSLNDELNRDEPTLTAPYELPEDVLAILNKPKQGNETVQRVKANLARCWELMGEIEAGDAAINAI